MKFFDAIPNPFARYYHAYKRYGYTCINYTILPAREVTSQPNIASLTDGAGPFNSWVQGNRGRFANCYAFAANHISEQLNGFGLGGFRYYVPHPGVSGGHFESVDRLISSKDEMAKSLIADGFLRCAEEDYHNISVPKGGYLIAAVCDGRDYHFYRLHEPSGIWYHKPGWTGEVTCLDDNKSVIDDPRKAAQKYNQFMGFFISPPNRKPLNTIIENDKGTVLEGDASADVRGFWPRLKTFCKTFAQG